MSKYTVLRDTQEKVGFWDFRKSSRCAGTEWLHLATGDYTLKGLETRFVIERKRNTGELAKNVFEERFERELGRLDAFEHAYLFLEFNLSDVLAFPENSGIPKSRWRRLRVRPDLLLKRLNEIQLAHPRLRIWFVGAHGKEAANGLFKRMADLGED